MPAKKRFFKNTKKTIGNKSVNIREKTSPQVIQVQKTQESVQKMPKSPKNPQTARKRLADLLDLRNRAEHEVAEMSEDDVKKVLEIARWLLSSID